MRPLAEHAHADEGLPRQRIVSAIENIAERTKVGSFVHCSGPGALIFSMFRQCPGGHKSRAFCPFAAGLALTKVAQRRLAEWRGGVSVNPRPRLAVPIGEGAWTHQSLAESGPSNMEPRRRAGLCPRNLWERSPTAISRCHTQGLVAPNQVGVGDASHK
jgi:hypothetical protein